MELPWTAKGIFSSPSKSGRSNYIAVELQTHSVNFGSVNVCAPGQTTPAPCSETLALNYNVNADHYARHDQRCSPAAAPNLDFTRAERKHLHRRIYGGRNLHSERDLHTNGRGHKEWLR